MKRQMMFYGTKKNGPNGPEKESPNVKAEDKPTKPMSKAEFKKAKVEARDVKKAVKQQARLEKIKSPKTLGEKFERLGNIAGTTGAIVGTISGIGSIIRRKKGSSNYE